MNDPRMYPDRPYLAVSAAIIRDGRVLIARRAKGASTGAFTLPGGVVEAGETLHESVIREIAEETGIAVEPLALAGQREFITRDEAGRVSRHFVILCFACRWISGEGTPLLAELVRVALAAAGRTVRAEDHRGAGRDRGCGVPGDGR